MFLLLISLDWLASGDFGPFAGSVSARKPCGKCLWTGKLLPTLTTPPTLTTTSTSNDPFAPFYTCSNPNPNHHRQVPLLLHAE